MVFLCHLWAVSLRQGGLFMIQVQMSHITGKHLQQSQISDGIHQSVTKCTSIRATISALWITKDPYNSHVDSRGCDQTVWPHILRGKKGFLRLLLKFVRQDLQIGQNLQNKCLTAFPEALLWDQWIMQRVKATWMPISFDRVTCFSVGFYHALFQI